MLWAFWVCTSFGVFLCLHIIQQVMVDTRKPSNFLIKSLGRMKPTFEESLQRSHVNVIIWMYTVRAHDRSFLHLWAWLEKRNWKPLWLSFGTQKPLPWVGKQYLNLFYAFGWINSVWWSGARKAREGTLYPAPVRRALPTLLVILILGCCSHLRVRKVRPIWVKSHVLRSSS